jgi:hypothetical protein
MSITKRYFTSLLSIRSYAASAGHRDRLDVRDDAVLGAGVEHLLRLADPADQ